MHPTVRIYLAGLLLAIPLSAQGTISHGDLTFSFQSTLSDPITGNADLIWQGVDQLHHAWFWYRCFGDAGETPAPEPSTQSFQGAIATLTWTDLCNPGAETTLRIEVMDCDQAPCQSSSRPIGAIALSLTSVLAYEQEVLFLYMYFDLGGLAGGDLADRFGSGTLLMRSQETSVLATGFGLPRVDFTSILQSELGDLTPTSFDFEQAPPTAGGDLALAIQRFPDEVGEILLLLDEGIFGDGFEGGDVSSWALSEP